MHVRNGFVISLSLLMFVVSISAHSADKKPREPLTIEADRAVIDEKKSLSTYTGNVVLVQGPNRFQADKLTVYGSKEGKITKILAEGSPIRFVQKSTTDKSAITGEALKMQYFAAEQRLLLLESAKLQQGNNLFSGDKIEYDTLHQVVTAEANKSGKGRVQVTINPDSLPDTKPKDTP